MPLAYKEMFVYWGDVWYCCNTDASCKQLKQNIQPIPSAESTKNRTMANFAFFITARNSASKENVLRVNINEWHELLFILCPNFAAGTSEFKFKREDVLSPEEIDMLEDVTYDEEAVSVFEEYEEYKEPNFESAQKWLSIFKKIEKKYFETEQDEFISGIQQAENTEAAIKKTIYKIRSNQFHFDQIKQSLTIANENDLEIAFTISDY